MGLGGAGGAAAAVTAGAAAQKDDHVAGGGTLTANVLSGSGSDDSADLHALGCIAGVIELVHLAGSQTDLVAVGAVACGGLGDDGALGQLALHGLLDGSQGVGSAGNAHSGIHIRTAGQGVTDGAAHAGGCAAKGLDLSGVVVGLVLEEEQPVFLAVVGVHLDLHGAGVDLFGLVQARHLALLLQVLGHQGANVHEVDGLGAVQALAHGQVLIPGLLEDGAGELHSVDGGQEGGVTAVVGPVGVDDLQLGHGGVTVLGAEVVTAEAQVVQVHGQTIVCHHGCQTILVQVTEALQGGHGLGDLIGHHQGLEGLQGGLAGFHGVNEVLLDGCHFVAGQVANQLIDTGGADQRTVALGQDLDALGGGVCTLVELTGQVLHSKDDAALRQGVGDQVQLGLGQDGLDAVIEQLRGDVFHIIPVEQPQALQGFDPEEGADIAQEGVSLGGQAGALFYIYPIYHVYFTSSFARRARAPMSLRQ